MSAHVPSGRGKSPVAGKWKIFKTKRARNIATGIGCAAVGFFFISGVNALLNTKLPSEHVEGTGSKVISQVTMQPPPPERPQPQPQPQPEKPAARKETKKKIVDGAVNYVRRPVMSGEVSFDVPDPPAVTDTARAAADAKTAAADARNASETKVAFKPSTISGGKAGPAIDLTYVMTPQLIPCALDVAMDSTLAGAIACHTTQAVYSPHHVLLMPPGTQITGTYKNDLKPGQARLFAFAGSAITQEGIPVPLDSGIADGLGRSGITATDVNNHVVERFGAALALTGADAALSLAQASLSKPGQSTFNLNSGGGGIESLANQILQKQIDIPQTISVAPGTIVQIVVDHPVDFSDAISVRTRK